MQLYEMPQTIFILQNAAIEASVKGVFLSVYGLKSPLTR